MTETVHGNFIGGGWREGADARPDINPSDTSDVIGRYAQASLPMRRRRSPPLRKPSRAGSSARFKTDSTRWIA
jgi:aldehyde dehydrogenase (NAD+)